MKLFPMGETASYRHWASRGDGGGGGGLDVGSSRLGRGSRRASGQRHLSGSGGLGGVRLCAARRGAGAELPERQLLRRLPGGRGTSAAPRGVERLLPGRDHGQHALCPEAGAQSNGCENSLSGSPGYRTFYPLHVQYQGTQMEYALKYLAVHRHTQLVTIDIGANDAFLLESGCLGVPACIVAGLPAVLADHRGEPGHHLPRDPRRRPLPGPPGRADLLLDELQRSGHGGTHHATQQRTVAAGGKVAMASPLPAVSPTGDPCARLDCLSSLPTRRPATSTPRLPGTPAGPGHREGRRNPPAEVTAPREGSAGAPQVRHGLRDKRSEAQEGPGSGVTPGSGAFPAPAYQSLPRRVRSVCCCHAASASVPGLAVLLGQRPDRAVPALGGCRSTEKNRADMVGQLLVGGLAVSVATC